MHSKEERYIEERGQERVDRREETEVGMEREERVERKK